LGLQNADVLLSINGFDMASPDSALQAYAQLPRATSLDVRLERRGTPVSLQIRIQ
jgi:general secretion pathway protein C